MARLIDSAVHIFIAIGAMSAAVAVCDIKLESREVMKESATSTPIGCPIAT